MRGGVHTDERVERMGRSLRLQMNGTSGAKALHRAYTDKLLKTRLFLYLEKDEDEEHQDDVRYDLLRNHLSTGPVGNGWLLWCWS